MSSSSPVHTCTLVNTHARTCHTHTMFFLKVQESLISKHANLHNYWFLHRNMYNAYIIVPTSQLFDEFQSTERPCLQKPGEWGLRNDSHVCPLPLHTYLRMHSPPHIHGICIHTCTIPCQLLYSRKHHKTQNNPSKIWAQISTPLILKHYYRQVRKS